MDFSHGCRRSVVAMLSYDCFRDAGNGTGVRGTSLTDYLSGFAAGSSTVDKDYVLVFWDIE